MSVVRGFGLNGKSVYENVVKPMAVNLNFVVDAANGNGLGIRQLKSNGYVRNVFMNTSSTPGSNDGQLNPNPAAGLMLVQFKNNFNYYLGGYSGFVSPVTGSSLTSITAHSPYIIGSLGTTTAAQWLAAGVPAGLAPAVGMSFVAIATGSIGGTGTVFAPGVSGCSLIEVIGDPNASISNSSVAANGGAYVLMQILGATNSSTTTLIPKAPASGTVIGMQFRFDGSSVSIPDQAGQTGI